MRQRACRRFGRGLLLTFVGKSIISHHNFLRSEFLAQTALVYRNDNGHHRLQGEIGATALLEKLSFQRRLETDVKEKAFDSIRDLQMIERRAEHFLRVLEQGKLSTNNCLRRFHNSAIDVGWLPWLVLLKRQWPPIHYKEKRAVTHEEHELILSRKTTTCREDWSAGAGSPGQRLPPPGKIRGTQSQI